MNYGHFDDANREYIITKSVQQMPASDLKSETLYLRTKRTDGYRVFSPFFVPTHDPYELFECHVRLG